MYLFMHIYMFVCVCVCVCVCARARERACGTNMKNTKVDIWKKQQKNMANVTRYTTLYT